MFFVSVKTQATHWTKWFSLTSFWFVKLCQNFFGYFWVRKVRKSFAHMAAFITVLEATGYDSF
jgi:hypothetical protein